MNNLKCQACGRGADQIRVLGQMVGRRGAQHAKVECACGWEWWTRIASAVKEARRVQQQALRSPERVKFPATTKRIRQIVRGWVKAEAPGWLDTNKHASLLRLVNEIIETD